MSNTNRGAPAALVLLVALVAASCGTDAADRTIPEDPVLGADAEGGAEPNPLNVVLTLDDAHTGTATIGPGGGVLEVTGADGTTFSLELPAGAVAEPTAISLTPITGMEPQPLSGGLNAGAQLTPEGLQLGVLATLTVRPADPPEKESAIALAWTGAGEDLSLTGVEGTPEEFRLVFLHFSGAAVGEGTNDDARRIADRAAARCSARHETSIRLDVALAQRQFWSGSDAPFDTDGIGDQLVAWFDRCVQQRLEEGKTEDVLLEVGIVELLGWEQVAQWFGLDGGAAVAGRDALGQRLAEEGLKAGLERATKACEAHDLTVVQRMIRWTAVAQALGFEDAALTSEALEERVRSCMTFELRYDATARFEDQLFGYLTETLRGAIVVTSGVIDDAEAAETGEFTLRGEGPIDITVDSTLPLSCHTVSDAGPAGASPSITGIPLSDGPSGSPDVTIPVAEGTPQLFVCEELDGVFDAPTVYFSLLTATNPDLVQGDALHLTGWQLGSGATWATRTFEGSTGIGHEHTTRLELVHTPGKAATSAPAGTGGSAFDPGE